MRIFSDISKRINAYRKITDSVLSLRERVQHYLPNDPAILEAGAHMGYDTLGISKVWPKGRVYAFEPVPALYESLNNRVGGRKNVFTYPLALGAAEGVVDMYVSRGASTGSSSILNPSKHLELYPSVKFEEKISVEMTTLNIWAARERVHQVDLMWLDMQGYEVNALIGAGQLLEQVRVIYTELCRSELYHGLVTKEEYIRFLRDHGFDLVLIESETDEITNGIFVNREICRR